jgi:hypothetical protein
LRQKWAEVGNQFYILRLLAFVKERNVTKVLLEMIYCFLLWLIYSVVVQYSCCNIFEPMTEIMIRQHINLISFGVPVLLSPRFRAM